MEIGRDEQMRRMKELEADIARREACDAEQGLPAPEAEKAHCAEDESAES